VDSACDNAPTAAAARHAGGYEMKRMLRVPLSEAFGQGVSTAQGGVAGPRERVSGAASLLVWRWDPEADQVEGREAQIAL